MGMTVNAPPMTQALAPQCVASTDTAKPVIGKVSFECFQFSDVDTPLWYHFGFSIANITDVSKPYILFRSLSHKCLCLICKMLAHTFSPFVRRLDASSHVFMAHEWPIHGQCKHPFCSQACSNLFTASQCNLHVQHV